MLYIDQELRRIRRGKQKQKRNFVRYLTSEKETKSIIECFQQLAPMNRKIIENLALMKVRRSSIEIVEGIINHNFLDQEVIDQTIDDTITFDKEVKGLEQEFNDYQKRLSDWKPSKHKTPKEKLKEEKKLLANYEKFLKKIDDLVGIGVDSIQSKLGNLKKELKKEERYLKRQLNEIESYRNDIEKIEKLELALNKLTEEINNGQKLNDGLNEKILFNQKAIEEKRTTIESIKNFNMILTESLGDVLTEEIIHRQKTDIEIKELYNSIKNIKEKINKNLSEIGEAALQVKALEVLLRWCTEARYSDSLKDCTKQQIDEYLDFREGWKLKIDKIEEQDKVLVGSLLKEQEELKAKVISRIEEEEKVLLSELDSARSAFEINQKRIEEEKERTRELSEEIEILEKKLKVKDIDKLKRRKEILESRIEEIGKEVNECIELNSSIRSCKRYMKVSNKKINLITKKIIKRVDKINDRLIGQARSDKNDSITEELYESIDQANSIDEVTGLMKEVTEAIGINDLPQEQPSTKLTNISYVAGLPLFNSTTIGLSGGYPALN